VAVSVHGTLWRYNV